jgi:hypothetical protein
MERMSKQNQAVVRAVLVGDEQGAELVLQGLLLIVYRLRHNLFHGEKWANGIRGKRDNSTHACVLMMSVLDAYPRHGI